MNIPMVIGLLEELNAILLLEYHNKNHLKNGGRPNVLNCDQREIIKLVLHELNNTGDRPETTKDSR